MPVSRHDNFKIRVFDITVGGGMVICSKTMLTLFLPLPMIFDYGKKQSENETDCPAH
jgi:hypothetical protein